RLDRAHGSENIPGPDGRGQAVVRVVRDAQRIRLVVEWDHGGDGTEDLLARDPGRVVDVIKDRRLHEEAPVERAARGAAAADSQLRLAAADLLILPNAIEVLAADERAHPGVALHRRADLDRTRLLDHRVDELLVDGPLHEDAAASGADLALIHEDAEQRAVDGRL